MLDDKRVWPAKSATESVEIAGRHPDLREGPDGHIVVARLSLISVSKQ